jgi:hypothetical protein
MHIGRFLNIPSSTQMQVPRDWSVVEPVITKLANTISENAPFQALENRQKNTIGSNCGNEGVRARDICGWFIWAKGGGEAKRLLNLGVGQGAEIDGLPHIL